MIITIDNWMYVWRDDVGAANIFLDEMLIVSIQRLLRFLRAKLHIVVRSWIGGNVTFNVFVSVDYILICAKGQFKNLLWPHKIS